jgi:arylsulfatase A-like enzyme
MNLHRILIVWTGALLALGASAQAKESAHVLVVVLDGLRPDYVTAERMPNLHAMGEEGVLCENHHAVFPTLTRVNSPSLGTGAYPGTHGLLGNSVYFPAVNPDKSLSTGDAENLFRIDEATNGRLLTTQTLGEILQAHGEHLFVASSGSTGSAMLQNYRVCGGAVVNPELVLPDSLRPRVVEALGPPPEDAAPNTGRNRWAVDAYLEVGLTDFTPRVAFVWLSDPDHTAHKYGVGSPVTDEALRQVDDELKRILDAHRERGIRADILIMSDHGFSTQAGGAAYPMKTLTESGLGDDVAAKAFVTADGAIYIRRDADRLLPEVVRIYQEKPWAGAIFTRGKSPGSHEGVVPGTLSFDLIHWDHDRSADVLIDAMWNDDVNEFGFPGMTTVPGVAGHGTSSPWDIHNALIARGPNFKKTLRSPTPSGNVDVAPTICRLIGIDPVPSMDGRVLDEILVGGPDPASVQVVKKTFRVSTKTSAGRYTAFLDASVVDGHRYLDRTRVERTPVVPQ